MMFQADLIFLQNIAQIVSGILSFAIAIAVIRKDSKSWANRLLAMAAIFMGSYIISEWIYSTLHIELVIIILARLSWILSYMSLCFLYLTFKVLVKSSLWLKKKSGTWPFIIAIIIYGIALFVVPDSIEIVSVELSKTLPDYWVLIAFAIGLFYFLLTSLVILIKVGVLKATGSSRRNMIITTTGLIICLIAIMISLIGRIVEELLYDIVFYYILAIGMIFVTYGITRRANPSS